MLLRMGSDRFNHKLYLHSLCHPTAMPQAEADAALTPPPAPPPPPSPPVDLYERLTPWQLLTFTFVFPIVRYGTYKPLQQVDLLPVAKRDRAARLLTCLEGEWDMEMRAYKYPSLNRALYRTHRRVFYLCGALLFTEYAIMLTKPVVLRYLLAWLKGTTYIEADVGVYLHWGYGFGVALALAGLDFMQTLVHHRAFYLTIRTGWRLRTAVQALLYKKVLSLDNRWQSTASTGQIVSTLANDCQRYEECATSLHFVWVAPLMALAGFGLLVMYVGVVSAAVGCVATVGVIPLQVWCGRQVGHARRVTAGRTDKRVKLMAEVLSGIQTVKAFVWEAPFLATISQVRASERKSLAWAARMRAITLGLFFVAPSLAAFVTFLTYWALGNHLELPTVFAVMTLLQTLRECARWVPRSIEQVSEALVASRRILPLLLMAEAGPSTQNCTEAGSSGGKKEGGGAKGRKAQWGRRPSATRAFAEVSSNKSSLLLGSRDPQGKELGARLLPPPPALPPSIPPLPTLTAPPTQPSVGNRGDILVEIEDSGFSWATGNVKGQGIDWQARAEFQLSLKHLSMRVRRGELLIVTGPVRSGKSTLLDAILGEVSCVYGSGVHLRSDLRMAYCSQQPWIQAGSIRENIIFAGVPQRQQETAAPPGNLGVSTPLLPEEDGCIRSNDSPARLVDEARYSNILQACALDHDLAHLPYGDLTEIGELGVNLSGGQRARVALARAVYADADLVLLDDVLSAVDPRVSKHLFHACILDTLVKAGKGVVLVTHQVQYLPLATRVCLLDAQGHMVAPCAPWEEIRTSVSGWRGLVLDLPDTATVTGADWETTNVGRDEGEVCDKAEEAEEGEGMPKDADMDVSSPDGSEALRPSGFLAQTPAVGQATGRETAAFIAAEDRILGEVHGDTYASYLRSGGLASGVWIMLLLLISQGVLTFADFWLKMWASDQDHARTGAYYPRAYAYIIAVCVVLGLLRADLFFRFALRASTSLHDKALQAVLAAPLAFFHSNPRGRILNKFSKDLDSADDLLPYTLFDFLQSAGLCVAAVVVGCIAVPYLPLIVAPLLYLFSKYRRQFVTTAREVKRLDAITRSPLYAEVSSSLQGGKVIRAFRAESMMEERFLRRLDENGKCAFLFIILSRYLGFRLDMLCATFLTFLCVLAVALHATLDPGLLGLSLTYALVLSGTFQWAIRQSAQAETLLTSVERLNYYTRLSSEEDEDKEMKTRLVTGKEKTFGQLSPNWPHCGELLVKNLQVRYREDLPIVLNGVDIRIRGGQKVGIVGRTGSGKSSFLSALLRLNQIVGGDVVLDGVSILHLSRHDARRSVAWIPQQPDLFAGTLRFNLDPFMRHGDAELHAALRDVNLSLDLDMPVGEGGGNLSTGTRQLLSLARAVLLRRKVLLMDEATASVSFVEDQRIQNTLRTAPVFRDCTLVTIAHRINTVIESDLILVFADGKCIEQGSPQHLLATSGSVFAEMVRETRGVDTADTAMSKAENLG